MMRIDILSLFPAMFDGPFGDSITKRAIENGIIDIHITNPRDYTDDKHHQVDDSPFGGGSGMVMKPEPMFRAVNDVLAKTNIKNRRILLMSPTGKTFTQEKAKELASYDQLIFICGHYEGFDARIVEHIPDEEISIGDYVLTGGEIPAMVVADAVARMCDGVLSDEVCFTDESIYSGLLEYPQYTRPREYEGMKVPDILISGDHAKIDAWRRKEALRVTLLKRPELLETANLSEKDKKILDELRESIE